MKATDERFTRAALAEGGMPIAAGYSRLPHDATVVPSEGVLGSVSKWLGRRNPRTVLISLTILLPFIPALIAGLMHRFPMHYPDSLVEWRLVEDGPILSAWTYIQVATFAYLVFLYRLGPPGYLPIYIATMAAHGAFMQQLGKPIGIGLAQLFESIGCTGGLQNALATYIHHSLLGLFTWWVSSIIVDVTCARAQRTTAELLDDLG